MISDSAGRQADLDLVARLRARRSEIEVAVFTRLVSVAEGGRDHGSGPADGLRAAVSAAVDYVLEAFALGEERTPPPPPQLLAEARLAAQRGMGLDTVLRRYVAGHALIANFVVEEIEGTGPHGADQLQRLLRVQAIVFDRLIAAVSEEHRREAEMLRTSPEQRLARRVERLLNGELVDTSLLPYDFEGHHLGAVVVGPQPLWAIREVAGRLDCRLLAIDRGGEAAWAWLGSRRRLERRQLDAAIEAALPPACRLSLGEPATGLAGWRLSHRQARAASLIAQRNGNRAVHYADVAILASALHDELLSTSLRQLCLQPLEQDRDGGETARETLRAYFGAQRNVTSAAAALGVSRQTVASRLRAIERLLGRPLASVAGEVEVALRLEQLEREALG